MAPDHNSPPAPSSHHTLSIPPPSLTEETTTTCTSDDVVKTSKKTARVQRGQWLRAAVLGANDGLLSTASLMLGVTSASEDRSSIIIAGVAGTVSGAFSMALGEFVSVCTQRDIERDANKEATQHKPTVEEGAALDHEKEEEEEEVLPNPIKAALASGLSFMVGSVIPLLACMFVTQYEARIYTMVAVTTVALAGFGGGAAYLGGSRQVGLSGARVLVGGWLAMAITYWLLKLLDSDDPTKKFSLAG